MSWLFGRRSLSASREKIQSNWGNGFIEQLQKKSKQFQESASKQQEYINKLEKVVEAARDETMFWNENLCNRTEYDQMVAARDKLKTALKELGGEK